MTKITTWEQRGFLIRHGETEASYLQRLAEIEHLPLRETPEILRQYGVDPGWVPVSYSNDNLHIWEAACAWQEQDRISIQLRKNFEDKNVYLGFYKKEEILAHEYVHAVRFPLHSIKYEEFFSYYLSKFFGSSFRAFVGPFFSKSSDTILFLITALMPLFAVYFETSTFLLVPGFMLAFFGARLLRTWRIFREVRDKIGLPLMMRLSDEEIDAFYEMTREQIQAWIEIQKKSSFRWQILSLNYQIP